MEDKSKLLDDLKIDREAEEAPAKVGLGLVVGLVVLALLVGGAGSYYLLGGFEDGASVPAASVAQTADIKPEASATPKVAVARAQEQSSTTQAANSQAPERLLNASGYITARRIATVSAEIMGLITEVRVEEGMQVERGQVLAQLDDAVAAVNLRFAEAQILVQKAAMESTVANLDEAKRVLKRVSELNTNDYSSTADVTRAQANVASLEAQVKRSEADIEVATLEASRQRERLADHTIRAPFDGIVTVKNAQPGEIVSPSSAGGGFTRTGICTIVDMDSLEIEVDVNEAFIGRVFEGQSVEANLDAYPAWTIPASVIAIIPTADRAKATVRVRIRIEEKDVRILPDMGVKVAFLKT